MWRLCCANRIGTAPCLFAIEIVIFRKTFLSKSTFFSYKSVCVRGILKAWYVLEGRSWILRRADYKTPIIFWIAARQHSDFPLHLLAHRFTVEVNLISRVYWYAHETAENRLAVFSQELWETELGDIDYSSTCKSGGGHAHVGQCGLNLQAVLSSHLVNEAVNNLCT